MRRASLILALALALVGCKERYNSLAGPSDTALVPVQSNSISAAAVSTNASSGRTARRRAVGKETQIEGIIKSVTAEEIVVISSRGAEVTVKLDSNTVIRHGGTLLTPEDLHEGDRVHVKARTEGTEQIAREVNLQNPAEDPEEGSTATANGMVIEVGDTQLTVRTVPHGDVVVQVDGSTIIKQQGNIIQLSDIKVGWELNSQGTRVDAHTILARQIEVRGNSKKK